jgi:hypothetical protein
MNLSFLRTFIAEPSQEDLDDLASTITVPRARLLRFLATQNVDVVACAWTSNLVLLSEGVRLSDSLIVHPDEYATYGQDCDRCAAPFHADDLYAVGPSEMWCSSCRDIASVVCEVCTTRVNEEDTNSHEDGRVCHGCVENGLVSYCECNGEYVISTCSCERDDEDEDLDDDDYDDSEGSVDGLIRSYTTDVVAAFGGSQAFKSAPTDPKVDFPLYLGVELEVHAKRGVRRAEAVRWTHNRVGGFALLKFDSSIPHQGFEITTVPGTLAFHRDAWEPFFAEAHKHLESWKTGRCGLHVHISRNALSPLQLGKMMVFINERGTSEFVSQIAGRSAGEYCVRAPKKVKDARRRQPSANRYEALTLSGHTGAKTAELRIFRGNLRKEGFFRCIEFTVALVEFCSACSIKDVRSPTPFLEWMSRPEQGGKYPALANWLNAKGRINVRRPKVDAEPV